MKIVFLTALSLALAWAVFFKAGVWPADWQITVLAVALVSAIYWLTTPFARRAPQLPPSMLWPTCLFPVYLVLQLIPLPIGILRALSPARALLLAHLAPVVAEVHSAPLSVNPPATLLHLFTFIAYILTFFLVRDLAFRFAHHQWIVFIPLLAIASLEAILGLIQIFFFNLPSGEPAGTYTNHDHFAGLLEMILPLACLYGVALIRRQSSPSQLLPAVAACGVWGLAVLLLVAIAYSLSRTGFLVSLAALFCAGLLLFPPRRRGRSRRLYSLSVLCLALFMLIVFPPNALLLRFADLSASGPLSADTRFHLWRETLPLIAEFPVFGCGLGGYESVFLKYQAVSTNFRAEFAHNDYLQFIAELGFAGAATVAIFIAGLARSLVRGILHSADEESRLLAIACAASLLAIALHSLVDFNLYVPANTMTLAWIAAVASLNGVAPAPAASPTPSP